MDERKMTLYDLTSQFMAVLDMARDPDADPESFSETLDALEGDIEDKADGYAKVIAQIDADSEAVDREIRRLTERKKVLDNCKKRMKDNLKEAMIATGKTKFDTPLFKFWIQKAPPSVTLTEGAEIPEEFLTPQEPKVNKDKIKEFLAEGNECEFATLEQNEYLRIK